MTWIYLIPILFLTDILLYLKYWLPFAKKFYFLDYGIGVGWRMAFMLRKKDG